MFPKRKAASCIQPAKSRPSWEINFYWYSGFMTDTNGVQQRNSALMFKKGDAISNMYCLPRWIIVETRGKSQNGSGTISGKSASYIWALDKFGLFLLLWPIIGKYDNSSGGKVILMPGTVFVHFNPLGLLRADEDITFMYKFGRKLQHPSKASLCSGFMTATNGVHQRTSGLKWGGITLVFLLYNRHKRC